MLNVKTDFGAVGDGVTYDTAALEAAWETGGDLYVPKGRYRIDDGIFGAGNTRIICEPGAVIDASELGEMETAVGFKGGLGSAITLAGDGDAGSDVLPLSSVAGLVPGDPLYISAAVLLPAGTPGIYIGEWQTIKSISGNGVRLFRPLDATYPVAAGAYVKKIFPVENITIEGLGVIGSGRSATQGVEGQVGISVSFGRNVRIFGCDVRYTDYNGIALDWVENGTVSWNRVQHADEGTNTAVQYGITFKGGSRALRLTENQIIGGKHGVAGSRNVNNGVHHDITIDGNTIEGTWHAAITTHDNARRVTVSRNKVVGCQRGIEIRVQDMMVTDNIIEHCAGLGEAIYLTEFPSRATVRGNRINHAIYGVRMVDSGLDDSTVPVDVSIEGNEIKNITSHGIYVRHAENLIDKAGWSIRGNKVHVSAAAYGVYMAGAFQGAVIEGNRIRTDDATTSNFGIYLLGGRDNVVARNDLDRTAGIRLATESVTGDVPDAYVFEDNIGTNMKPGFNLLAIVNGTNILQL